MPLGFAVSSSSNIQPKRQKWFLTFRKFKFFRCSMLPDPQCYFVDKTTLPHLIIGNYSQTFRLGEFLLAVDYFCMAEKLIHVSDNL